MSLHPRTVQDARPAPELLIRIALEAKIRVDAVWACDADGERLIDWVNASPERSELLGLALALEREAGA